MPDMTGAVWDASDHGGVLWLVILIASGPYSIMNSTYISLTAMSRLRTTPTGYSMVRMLCSSGLMSFLQHYLSPMLA